MREASRQEEELMLYWRVMQEGVAIASLAEYQEELEVLSLMSDWPRLKASCAKSLRRFDHMGRVQRAANLG